MVNWLQQQYPAIRLVVPKVIAGSSELVHIELAPDCQIIENKWGIPEPVAGQLISAADIDFCLVPLLAADSRGHRLGYGGGFYDRFLAQCKPGLLSVGISLFEILGENIETDEFDIPLTACIFPSGIYYFS